MKNNFISVGLFVLMVVLHFIIWNYLQLEQGFFYKYYLYLSAFFIFVLVLINLFHYLVPQYLGFAILGIYIIIMMLAFIIKTKMNINYFPDFRFHVIISILITFAIVTYNGIWFLKNEKNNG